jgi:UrcA family protein
MSRAFQLIVVAGMVVLANAQVAQAEAPKREIIDSIAVSYNPLDLRNDAGARTMLKRLESAAYRVCGGDPRRQPAYKIMPKHVKAVITECREDAVARAVASVNEKTLWQVFASSDAGKQDAQPSGG